MTAQEIEKEVKADGWYFHKPTGSHKHYKHPPKPGKVTIPQHKGDIHPQTIETIRKQAGLK